MSTTVVISAACWTVVSNWRTGRASRHGALPRKRAANFAVGQSRTSLNKAVCSTTGWSCALIRVEMEFRDGHFRVAGTDHAMTMSEVARAFYYPIGITDQFGVGLEASGTWSTTPENFPNGCHVCELEVDPETGEVHIDRYVVVDD